MRYLITGGAGFIGSHLADELLLLGHQVVVLDNFSNGNINNLNGENTNLCIINGDINNAESLEKAFTEKIDGVFHLAGKISVEESFKNPSSYVQVNVDGTLKIIEKCIKHNVNNIVFSSTCAIYGDSEKTSINENDPTSPLSPYACTKLVAENYGRLFAQTHSLNFIAIRYFNVYGSRQKSESSYTGVLPLFIEKAKNRQIINIYGDGNQTRDFVHVKDVVHANIISMKKFKYGFNVYNCCTNIETSVLKVVNIIEEYSGFCFKKKFLPKRIGDVFKSKGSYALLNTITGWTPQHTLGEYIMSNFDSSRISLS